MFWISLCVRNVSLALSLPVQGPFHGLDVQFLLEKSFATLTMNIFITALENPVKMSTLNCYLI